MKLSLNTLYFIDIIKHLSKKLTSLPLNQNI